MKLTLERGLPARPATEDARSDGRQTLHARRTPRTPRIEPSCPLRVLGVARACCCARRCRPSAQMTGAPTAGYKREPGMPASALPAPLREIGFDQNLDQPLPLDIAVHATKQGRTVRSATTSARRPVVLAFVYYDCPMLCTQVLNALASALGVLSLAARQGLRDRHRQLRSARDAGAGGGEEGRLPRSATSGPAPPPAGIS